MGIDHDRPQSGYFDAHPPRNAYPAHKGCEPVTEQPSEPQEAPSEPAE